MFLNRSGSPIALASVKVENGSSCFSYRRAATTSPGTSFARSSRAASSSAATSEGDRTINWVGVRPPKWPAANANAKHTYGKPVELFDGTSLDAFGPQSGDKIIELVDRGRRRSTNTPPASNLVSKQKFKDFKLQAEYKLAEGQQQRHLPARPLRAADAGRLRQAGRDHGHMAIYGWTPPLVNASKPPGEWQTLEAILVGNRVTATLNGQKVHDNAEIQAITGGAIDADEAAPGPLLVQGDHAKVWFRKIDRDADSVGQRAQPFTSSAMFPSSESSPTPGP